MIPSDDIQINEGKTGIYRRWGSVSTGQASSAILAAGTLKHTDGSTLNLTVNGSAFTGTVALNDRDLYLESTSHLTGGTTRLWNFQLAISGNGNVRGLGGANPDGSFNVGPRIRIRSTANN